jgi:hypothetical protein
MATFGRFWPLLATFGQKCHKKMCYYGIVIKDIKSSPLTFMILEKASAMVSFSIVFFEVIS